MHALQTLPQAETHTEDREIPDQVLQASAGQFRHRRDQVGRFMGPTVEMKMSASDFISGLWNYLTNANAGVPKTMLPVRRVYQSYFTDPGGKQLTSPGWATPP